jgi:hypothetical protein
MGDLHRGSVDRHIGVALFRHVEGNGRITPASATAPNDCAAGCPTR